MLPFRKNFILGFILTLTPPPSFALDLGQPIGCRYGKDCFISNYFDHDASPDIYKDHDCGAMSEDGHKSTDFILMNYPQMEDGVNVMAGDTGVVKYVRDDMSDVSIDLSGTETIRGRECGNGIVIEHKRGYETEYCHLKQGSITVKVGEKVDKGQAIAQVGLSGLTNFPYLRFTVRVNGKAVDPFTGDDPVTGVAEVSCESLDIYPIWDKQTEKKLVYKNTALLNSGFSEKVPNAQGAREGKYTSDKIPASTQLMAFWVDVLGVLKGDQMRLSIISPTDEEIFSEVREFNADKRHLFQFIGKKLNGDMASWPAGEYTGRVELFRKSLDKIETVLDVRTPVQVE